MISICKLKLFGLEKRLNNSKELAIRTSEKFSIQPLNSDDIGEIRRVQDVLNPDENVILVARQSESCLEVPTSLLILFTQLKND